MKLIHFDYGTVCTLYEALGAIDESIFQADLRREANLIKVWLCLKLDLKTNIDQLKKIAGMISGEDISTEDLLLGIDENVVLRARNLFKDYLGRRLISAENRVFITLVAGILQQELSSVLVINFPKAVI